MAEGPWITPQEVRDYSGDKAVKARSDAQFMVDISRAEQYIITYTNNRFEDQEEIPPAVKTADLILSEAYAHNAAERSRALKSETYDDYSYTAESNIVNFDELDLGALLDPYVNRAPTGTGRTIMKLRKL